MKNYSTREELEELGDGIVKSYIKKEGIHLPVRCIDVEGLAGFLGMNVVFRTFAEDDPDKIGFMSDGHTALRVRENGNAVPVIFPWRTIVIENALHRDTESGRCRFTIAHEIAHFFLDRHSPEPWLNRDFDLDRDCSAEELRRHFNMIKIQADRLAAAILMPRFIVDQALQDVNHGNKVRVYGENVFPPAGKAVIQKMADQAGVSYTAMRIRLKEFSLLDYCPIAEYVEENILGGLK